MWSTIDNKTYVATVFPLPDILLCGKINKIICDIHMKSKEERYGGIVQEQI